MLLPPLCKQRNSDLPLIVRLAATIFLNENDMTNKTSFDQHTLVANVGLGTPEMRSHEKQVERVFERLQFKESLRRTEERFAIAFRASPVPMASRATATETILLVDDEVMLREMAKTVLTKQGYHVLAGGTGPEALQVFAQNQGKIDLLFTDMVMPEGLSGRDLAEILIGM